MEILVIWVLFGICAAVVASNRGANGCLWFGLGVLLGPIGFALAFTTGTKCPKCASRISEDAKVCPNCGHVVPVAGQERVTVTYTEADLENGVTYTEAVRAAQSRIQHAEPPPPAQSEPTKRCPFCAEKILAEAKKCRYCGEFLEPRPPSDSSATSHSS